MHFKTLCILLLIKTLKIDGKGHRPFSKRVQGIGEVTPILVTTNENINLPNGFNPQPSPMNPMLYPFATQQPIRTITGTTSGWRPIIRRGTTKIPILEDRFATASKESNSELGTVRVTTRPILQQTEFIIPEKAMDIESSTSTKRNGVWRQIGGFVEGANYNRPFETSQKEQTKISNQESTEKQGRRRIANFMDKKEHETPVLNTMDFEKSVQLNVADDYTGIISIAKQMNESVEFRHFPKHSSKERLSNVDSDADISIESYNQTSGNFEHSHESNKSHERNISNKFYNFFDNSSEPDRVNDETNYDDIFTPTSSFNITKVGIPFEDQSSAEELSICVPLSVRERSLSNENEIVDVERVYCFPLPTQDKTKVNENVTVSMDAQDVGALNYENSITSNAVKIKAALTVISIGIFLL